MPCTGSGQGAGNIDSNTAIAFSINSKATSWAGGAVLVDRINRVIATMAPTTPSASASTSDMAAPPKSKASTIRAVPMAQVNRLEGIRSASASVRRPNGA